MFLHLGLSAGNTQPSSFVRALDLSFVTDKSTIMSHDTLLGMRILSADLKGALIVSPNPPRYYGSPVGSSCIQILGKPGLLIVVEILKISLMLSCFTDYLQHFARG